jgi:hypothetical protein
MPPDPQSNPNPPAPDEPRPAQPAAKPPEPVSADLSGYQLAQKAEAEYGAGQLKYLSDLEHVRERLPRESEDPEPAAQQKRIWSSLSGERDGRFCQAEEDVFSWMAEEAGSRRGRGQKIVCVMDGQPSLWAMRRTYLPGENVVEILDLLHVTPRLWEAAYLFHREGSEEAASFVRDRLLRILHGEAGYVIGGLRQMGTKHGLRGHRLAKLTTLCNY